MIKLSRISGIIFRHLVPTFRDPIRLVDALYYPLVDIILFGFLAKWAQAANGITENFMLPFLTCVACWYLIYRSALEISRNLLIEIWDNHLINLLATPLTITEFALSLMSIGLVQATLTFLYSSTLIYFIFSENIFKAAWLTLPYLPLFILFGWSIGLLTASLIFYFGKSIEFVAWAIPWGFAIISGAYYSLNLFPPWFQTIAKLFPGSYLFEGVRETLTQGASYTNLLIGSLLSIFYLIIAFKFLIWMFNKSKEKGLNNLD